MSVTAGVSDTVIAVRDKLRDAADEDGDIRMFKVAESPTQDSHSYNVRKDDPRLRRWVESRTDNREDVRADHRRFRQAEIVATTEEEAMTHQGWKRRKRTQMPRRKEDKGLRRRCCFKGSKKMKLHCFRQKTRKGRKNLIGESRKKKLEERKRKTKQIVVEEIWKDKGLDQEANIVADIDSDDEVNEAEEYEAWKTGEIVRIKSDREGREAMLKEEDETEMVRNMTEEERSEWERTNLKPAPQPKQKWMFMQKYYHKGAFFQSEADGYATRAGTDGIYARHYSAPTGEAKMDITNCPKSLKHCKCRES
ncbi:hypothetical protein C1H46_015260 [Malus baccata]|uniref:Micro-fibrillar-associated protein 1 C-terminal domain-containing protein n=1 Tax=Malus baccata TaxID=106549 RepID=A0A540MK32_MALBA|nr:hypothetical protein C1H46_015260 [Malus baccata]